MEIQGHRGMRGLRPENTLPAFEAAIEAGAHVLELDIQATRDEELVIHHDYFINRDLALFLDGSPLLDAPLIRSLTLAEVKKYDLGSKINPRFPDQILVPGSQIPTLHELFSLMQMHPSKSVRLNLEIKRDPCHPEWTLEPHELAKKVVSQVHERGFADKIYYSSFDPAVLHEIKNQDPDAKIGFIFNIEKICKLFQLDPEKSMELVLKTAIELKAVVLSPHHKHLKDQAHVRSLQTMGFRVIPWTVNDPSRWAELVEMGVDGMITDYPHKLIKFIN